MLTGPIRLLSHYLHAQGQHTTTMSETDDNSRSQTRKQQPPWRHRLGPDDYDVFKDERCIGRIFQSPAAPSARNWMWTIIAREHPPTIYNRGYSATREQAMADFTRQWQSELLGPHYHTGSQ